MCGACRARGAASAGTAAAWARRLLSSGDGLAVQVVFWTRKLGSCELCLCKLCLGELGILVLELRRIVCVISAFTPKVLAIDVDEAANRKQRREYVGYN